MSFFKYVTPLLLVFIFSCAGNLEKDIAKFDKYYGYCDNPHRNIKGIEYDICKEKERAAGPGGAAEDLEPFDIADFFSNRGEEFKEEMKKLKEELDDLEVTVLPAEDREKLQEALDTFQSPFPDIGRVADELAEGANSLWFFIKLAIR